MFGYVNVDRSEMLGKDFDTYKAIYCSLCKQLGKEYSFLARFILSYDCTFYAVVALALAEDCPGFCTGRCKFNPLKKCNYLNKGEEDLSKAAALSIITAYYKIIDNISDGSILEKLVCYVLKPVFSIWHKKAKENYPQLEEAVATMSESQFEVEKDRDCSIDKSADPTAKMLSSVMAELSADETDSKIYSTFGYFLGKWIYLIDAANDYDDDLKRNSFNPYIIAFNNDKEGHINDINESLNTCLSQMFLAYNLIKVKRFDRIIENVLIHSLPKKQRSVLYKESKNS